MLRSWPQVLHYGAEMKSQTYCSIIGAIRIDSLTGAVREIVILEPGAYFRIEQLKNGGRAPHGRVWIRHENCNCYEVSEGILAEATSVGSALAFAA
jgi:hypothetical protein